MVRFGKNGSDVTQAAIRAARGITGKDKVAICGYHGWHDWYLATNISSNNNLDNHLLPGLNPLGVPKGLKDTIIPFNFNLNKKLILFY